MDNNYFYAEIPNDQVYMFRGKNVIGETYYYQSFNVPSNEFCIVRRDEDGTAKDSMKRLIDSMDKIIQ